MQTTLALALLATATGWCAAQDRMAETLRKGVIEEDTNRNLNAAIQSYQAVLAQYGEDRKSAATAVFRLAECYRKQGKSKEAIAAYSRVVRDFGDQTKLADPSRNQLSKTYKIPQQQAAVPVDPATAEARRRYRALLQERIQGAEMQMDFIHKQYQLGAVSLLAMYEPQAQLARFQGQLAAFDAGLTPQLPAGSRTPEALAARAQYKAFLQTEIDYAAKNVDGMHREYELGAVQQRDIVDAQVKLVDAKLELAAVDAGLAVQPATAAGLAPGADPAPQTSVIAQKTQLLDLRNKILAASAHASALQTKCQVEKKSCDPLPAQIIQLASALHDLDVAMQPGRVSNQTGALRVFNTWMAANAILDKLDAEFPK
jgi:tetratricopeptide (TPR) repeat protein